MIAFESAIIETILRFLGFSTVAGTVLGLVGWIVLIIVRRLTESADRPPPRSELPTNDPLSIAIREAALKSFAESTPTPRQPAAESAALIDEDVGLILHLGPLPPEVRAELLRLLEAPEEHRRQMLMVLASSLKAGYADVATLIEKADTDELVRLRLLRAIRAFGA